MPLRITKPNILLATIGLLSSWLLPQAAAESERAVTAVANSTAAANSTALTPFAKAADSAIVLRYAHRREGRYIQSGLRIETQADGVLVSSSPFPPGGEPKILPLPAHLGGGYIFFQAVSSEGKSATNIYRSQSFTSQLTPLAQLPFVVMEMRAGFDRLYALGIGVKLALDADSGSVMSLAPLPDVVAIEGLEFAGSNRGAVLAPLVGALTSEDAGLSWKPIAEATALKHSTDPEQLLINTAAGVMRLEQGGVTYLATTLNSDRGKARDAEELSVRPSGFASRDDWGDGLQQTLSSGVPVGDEIIALSVGHLFVATAKGKFKVSQHDVAADPRAQCKAVTDGAEAALFLCGNTRFELFRYSNKKLTGPIFSVPRVSGERDILAAGSGAFLAKGNCTSTPAKYHSKEDRIAACWLTRESAQPISGFIDKKLRVDGGTLSRHVAYATSRDGAWLIGWNQKLNVFLVQTLTSSKAGAPAPVVSYPLPKNSSLLPFLSHGSLLPEASAQANELLFWVVQGDKFIGVKLIDEKAVEYGTVQRPLSRALIHGSKALIWGASGFAKQSLDGGLHFEEFSLPYRSGDPELSASLDPLVSTQMGCGEAGCALGYLLRRGWNLPQEEAQAAEKRALPPPGGGRQHFVCKQQVVNSQPRLVEKASSFEGFWELRPPQLTASQVGLSASFAHDSARLYAFGPRDLPWNRDGRLELWYIDPYDVGSVKKTKPASQLIGSALDAEARLGTLDQGSAFSDIALDPDGRDGLILLRSRSQASLLGWLGMGPLFEVPLVSTDNQQEIDLRSLSGIVQSGGALYLAHTVESGGVAVSRVDASGFQRIGRYPLGDSGNRGVKLVRTPEGDLGLMMEGDVGLFVYPLSRSGELGKALLYRHRSTRPPSCEPEATGYIVDREMSLSPYLETSHEEPLKTSALRAKILMGASEPCLLEMTARVRALPQLVSTKTGSQVVPLSLLDSDSSGKRVQLLCE